MKQFSKWIALLLAGMLTAASLFACANDSAWGVEDGDDDEDEEQSEKKDDDSEDKDEDEESFPSPKTPDALRDALINANDVLIKITRKDLDGNERSYTTKKDGDIAEMTYSATGAEDETAYYDFQNSLFYRLNGEWTVESTSDDMWGTMLEELFGIDHPYFSTDHYDETDGKYVLKEDSLSAEGMPDGTTSVEMTADGHTSTIQINCEEKSFTITATFKAITVELPEVDPDDSKQPAQTEDAPSPDPTEEPIEPTEDAPAIDTSSPSMTPEEIGEKIYTYDNVCVTFQHSDYILSISRDGDIWKITYENWGADDNPTTTSYFDASTNYSYQQDENDDWYKEYVEDPTTWENLLIKYGVPKQDEYFFDSDNYGVYDSDAMEYSFTDEALDRYQLESGYLQYYGSIYIFHEQKNAEDDQLQYNLFFDNSVLTLPPSAVERPATEEDDEPVTEEVSFDSTPYENLNPDALYDALLTSEEVYLFVEINGDQAKIEKSGDIVSAQYYTASTEQLEIYYVDLSSQTIYQWLGGDQYPEQEYNGTWEDIMKTAQIHDGLYFLQDRYYKAFDENSSVLEVDPALLSHSIQSATLQRSGAYYHLDEKTTASQYASITIHFKDTDTELPGAIR